MNAFETPFWRQPDDHATAQVHVAVTLTSLAGAGRTYEAPFAVNMQTMNCIVAASELHDIGVEPVGEVAYRLPDGSIRNYAFGGVRIDILGEVTCGRVVFGPEGIEPILGMTALDSVGVVVDTVSGTWRRLPAIRLKVQDTYSS